MTNPTPAQKADLHLYDIVDDLLENDLLGLLLSTNHFQRYCKFKSTAQGITYSGVLMTLAACPATAAKFQNDALQQFSGLHIEECRFSTQHELAKHLDVMLKQFFEHDAIPDAQFQLSIEIENAWKYRRACQGIRP
jgi:hypothetical protein